MEIEAWGAVSRFECRYDGLVHPQGPGHHFVGLPPLHPPHPCHHGNQAAMMAAIRGEGQASLLTPPSSFAHRPPSTFQEEGINTSHYVRFGSQNGQFHLRQHLTGWQVVESTTKLPGHTFHTQANTNEINEELVGVALRFMGVATPSAESQETRLNGTSPPPNSDSTAHTLHTKVFPVFLR